MNIDTAPMKALWKQAFGDPDTFIDGFFSTGFSPEQCCCLHDGDRLTAALYWFRCVCRQKKVAYIYAVATEERYRGQGMCRKLMEKTHALLKSQGYAGAILVPAKPELISLYEKLGYSVCCSIDKRTIAAADPVALTPISPDEYRVTRLKMLGDHAAQQVDGWDFLLTYNGFYKAEGCIFCAAQEKDTVYFQEFLGDTAKLPGIIAALGGKTGVVRLPGTQPFAMYHGFTDDPPPTYFNLPMD